MNNNSLCIDCFNVFYHPNKRVKKCPHCRGRKPVKKKLLYSNLNYKHRFCERCDRKFRTLKKRPKICPDCRLKPYPNIFS